jgi:hypothetical protein
MTPADPDAALRVALARHRAIATGLLVLMAALLLAGLASGCGRATSAAAPSTAAGAAPAGAPPTPTPAAALPIAVPSRSPSSQLGPASPSGQAASQIAEITGTLSEYSISLSEEGVRRGIVRFTVQNIGRRKHNLRITGNGVDEVTRDLAPGQTGRVEVRFVDPGPYTVYCDLADHADRGMQMTFTIEA